MPSFCSPAITTLEEHKQKHREMCVCVVRHTSAKIEVQSTRDNV